MNANELADELTEISLIADNHTKMVLDVAKTMLRQQQAEIERLIGAEPITHGMLTFCKNCGQQNPYFEEKPAKYTDAWWKEVAEFNKQLKAQEK
jgi:hypothetical protein